MKILVAGIGGIGGWVAATLARGGAEVSLLARGATRERIAREGLTLVHGERRESFALDVFDKPPANAAFDVVIICTKTQDFPAICQGLEPVFNAGTDVVAAVNGLPWWFLDTLGEKLRGLTLESIDPGGHTKRLLGKVNPVGAVVHASAHALEPGVVRLLKADRLILGDPPRHMSARTHALAAYMQAGGVAAPVVANINEEIWAKLWGNENMNPISALTRLSSLPILATPELGALVRDMMCEFDAIGRRLGLSLPMDADERIAITKKLGDFRTSMLADAEAGRRLEHEGILGCVVELADKLDIKAPVSRIVYALLKGLALSFARK